jgi:uncharacterized membrane protein
MSLCEAFLMFMTNRRKVNRALVLYEVAMKENVTMTHAYSQREHVKSTTVCIITMSSTENDD